MPRAGEYNYSFSGLKTAFLNLVNQESQKDALFIQNNINDLCASMQHTIVKYLLKNFTDAAIQYKVKDIALAGGVSANSLLRKSFLELGATNNWNVFIPPFEYCTDNAAMIAMTGYFKYNKQLFSSQSDSAKARLAF
jgi:N6-L-threonylcarbamoyladenine synthase